MASFNLLDEPWIPVITPSGREDVGLLDLFRRAAQIRDLRCETPPMMVAVYRLLLAIVHRATEGPQNEQTWSSWWRDGLPVDRIVTYLEEHRDRFDLFHPERPFGQDVGLRGREKPAGSLIPESGWWPHQRDALTPAEAARWILWLHAWDAGGMRGRHGGGNAPGTPSGPLAYTMHVRLVAGTLERTVLLSLQPYAPARADAGWWERPVRADSDLAPRKRVPSNGLVHRLCWPSRRVRLVPDQDGTVSTAYLAAGDAPAEHLTAMDDPTAAVNHLGGDTWLRTWLTDNYPTVLRTAVDRVSSGALDPATRVRVELTATDYNTHRSLLVAEQLHRTPSMPVEAWLPGTQEHARLCAIANLRRIIPTALERLARETKNMYVLTLSSTQRNRIKEDIALRMPADLPDPSNVDACDQWDRDYRARAWEIIKEHEYAAYGDAKRSTEEARKACTRAYTINKHLPPVSTGRTEMPWED